ncbi:glycosyltransferase family 4 protein [Pareuzebyella sediminis]|uniref:glycosyltransferase family 4 protein n=1 Tax=Pareuzebyella sediminis TaxID=2607998 RepID=UPI0011F06E80|nr:glycosyltransferase family 4 protein [Pareuzebyella sediminis]
MKKKSIAFIIGSLGSGGAERVVSTLCNGLIGHYDIAIITFIASKPFYSLDKKVSLLHCSEVINPSENLWQAIKTNYNLYKKISGFLKSERIDLSICFLTSSNILGILASRSRGIPVIVSERIDPNASKKSFVWEKLRRFTYPKANLVVVQTAAIKRFFTRYIDEAKVIILPNPLSPDLQYDLNHSKPAEKIILNVGRLTNQKGQDMLIRAFGNINPKDWKLIIIGEGPNRGKYEEMIEQLNMKGKIILPGNIKAISPQYASARIFAFTSRFEGFPNALIEAMHMGLPSIATDCPTGPSELIEDGNNGFLINVGDQTALEEKLGVLIKDPQMREIFGRKGREKVKRFKTHEVISAWESVIQSTLD